MRVNPPAIFAFAFCVDRDNDALTAESFAGFQDEFWVFDSACVDGNFIAARRKKFTDILDLVYPAADCEGNKKRGRDFLGHFDHCATLFMGGRNIKKNQLIGFLLVISLGAGYGIASIFQRHEFDPFDNSSLINIQTWDNASGKHGSKGHLIVLKLLENIDDGCGERDYMGYDGEQNSQDDQEDHADLVERGLLKIRGLPKEDKDQE